MVKSYLRSVKHWIVRLLFVRKSRIERALTPISAKFGIDRGRPIDRHYIEIFMTAHRQRIAGRVLEIGAPLYANAFPNEIETLDVLHVNDSGGSITITGDLQDSKTLERHTFDCIILTQVLPFLKRPEEALRNAWNACSESGCLLITVPTISQVSEYDRDRWGDYWRFTEQGLREIVVRATGREPRLFSFGNVVTCCGFLQGCCCEDLPAEVFEKNDRKYPLVVTCMVSKNREHND